jgi:hypothetical protein
MMDSTLLFASALLGFTHLVVLAQRSAQGKENMPSMTSSNNPPMLLHSFSSQRRRLETSAGISRRIFISSARWQEDAFLAHVLFLLTISVANCEFDLNLKQVRNLPKFCRFCCLCARFEDDRAEESCRIRH